MTAMHMSDASVRELQSLTKPELTAQTLICSFTGYVQELIALSLLGNSLIACVL